MTTLDTPRCCATVYPSGAYSAFRGHPCTKQAKIEREGKWYCGMHDPVAVHKKRAVAQAVSDAKWAAEHSERKRQRDCLTACVGLANPVADVDALKAENRALRAALETLERSLTVHESEDSLGRVKGTWATKDRNAARALLAKGSP